MAAASADSIEQLACSVNDFLTAASWKHALFTTYALSLSYFESEVMRALLGAGCDDIWLIADAEGYRNSLLERRSIRVGQEYHLVPVALPNGVFHPKCIYLVSDDEQLLLVGSGNVTFGGHGNNTEVFEALTPDRNGTAFSDFADFLRALAARPDIRIGRRDWIDEFSARAEHAGSRGSDEDTEQAVRLLHPLESSAVAQLGNIFEEQGNCERVRIISPYHDPTGQAVYELASAVNAPDGIVAVTDPGKSPFPFSESRNWDRPVLPEAPQFEHRRFVHAKWMEFDLPGKTLVFTGSFNATRKALTTTENVELGVLRYLPSGKLPLKWEPVDAPAFDDQPYPFSGHQDLEVVFASFGHGSVAAVEGQILSSQEAAGPWRYRVMNADGHSCAGETTVDEKGEFRIEDSALEAFYELPSLQIVLRKEEREARGWLHNEMLLSIGSRRRLTAGALGRLMRREGSDDDTQALLDYFSVFADKHLRVFGLPIVNAGEETEKERGNETVVRVDIEDLAPIDEASAESPTGGNAAGNQVDHFEAAMLRLRRMLLGQGRKRALKVSGQSEMEPPENGSGADYSKMPSQPDAAPGLEEFETAISAMIDDASGKPAVLTSLLVLQYEVGMRMRLDRSNGREGAFEFLGNWLKKACRSVVVDKEVRSAISQHIVTGSAIAAILAASDESARILVGLHDDLEKYYAGPVDRDHAEASLVVDPDAGFAAELAFGVPDLDMSGGLKQILQTLTRRQQLEDSYRMRTEGQPIREEWGVFQSPLGHDLYAAFQADNWSRRIKLAIPDLDACSFCYAVYPVHERSQYRHERIGHCVQCNKYSLDVAP